MGVFFSLGPLQDPCESRSSSLINKKVIEFIEKKDPKPWAAYYSLTEAHTPLIVESGFKGKSSHGDYGDTILQMDAMVGKVLDMLDSSGQAENTLVYYTSDHGGHIDLGQKGGWNAPFTGGKGNGAREGGIRVPGIVRLYLTIDIAQLGCPKKTKCLNFVSQRNPLVFIG